MRGYAEEGGVAIASSSPPLRLFASSPLRLFASSHPRIRAPSIPTEFLRRDRRRCATPLLAETPHDNHHSAHQEENTH
jgi:hypothetical protein